MKKTLLFLFVVLFLVSCGKKEVKQISSESRLSAEAFALAETVKNAFIKKDFNTIRENTTEDGYRDITRNTKSFDKVELVFTPRWVEIESNQVLVNIAWKSTWTYASKRIDERGMAIFIMEGRPLKITKILRANPFIFPEQ